MRLLAPTGWLALSLTACHTNKPAEQPKTAPVATAAGGQEGEAGFEPDAMRAMVGLMSKWALGIGVGEAETPSAWHRHEASGTCMPKGSKSWQLTDERQYAADDESVSMWNESVAAQVTLYTYPAAQPRDAAFGEALSHMASRTCTEGPVISTESGQTMFGGCVQRRDDGALLLEQVLVRQRGKWLHKARITFAAATHDSSYSAAMALVRQAFSPCPEGAGTPPGKRRVERLERASRAPLDRM